MAAETNPSVAKEQIPPLKVGLSQYNIALLERVALEGQIKDLDMIAVRRIRGAAALLSGAQLGMQWRDFDHQTDPIIRLNRDFYLELRSLVLATLYPMVYSGRTAVPNTLPRDEAFKIQGAILGFKKVLNKFADGISLDQTEKENMQIAVQFFKEFGIKEMHSTRRRS